MQDLIILIASLAIILILFKWKLNLTLTMIIAALFLGIVYRFSLVEISKTFYAACLSRETLEIAATLFFVIIFNLSMSAAYTFKKIINNMKNIISDIRWIIAVVPAVIGFLPMFGGALVSAPVVKEVTQKMGISSERKTFLNFWFRHIWEYTLPLYPGIILAAGILGLPLYRVITSNSILTVSAIIIGVIWGTGRLKWRPEHSTEVSSGKGRAILHFLFNLSPIILVIILVLVFRLKVLYALLVAIVFTIVSNQVSIRKILRSVAEEKYGMILMVFAIMIFKEMLGTTGIIERLPLFFKSAGIPRYLVISFLPFIVGFLTGMTMAAVGITFPVILPLFDGKLSLMTFSFMCGFAGVLLTPVHFCLSLTREYFQADWLKFYRKELIVPVFLMIMVGLIYAVIV
ncbi:DUF401 family protein [bacterium]|nr:DUF401 family protein [bacterium]NIO19020.1 DUF401 family protein [bacterium]NIO74149.1 DUF401 family protein [bacterium]